MILLAGKHVGVGSFRAAFSLEGQDAVIKVANYGCEGECSNLAEVDVWEEVKGTPDAKYFGSIHDHCPDGGWLVMEWLDNISLDDDAEEARDVGGRHGVMDIWTTYNMGKRNGRVKIRDYGLGDAYYARSGESPDE